MSHKIKGYGWSPDLPDQRDLSYAAPRAVLNKLPSKVDLTKKCPPVYNQGNLGSCTANAIGAAIQFELMKTGKVYDFMPSRLFIYYNERVIEHTVNSDAGAQIRNGIKTVNHMGVCPEDKWPYIENKFTKKPLASCYKTAESHQVISYHRITRTLSQMKSCLADGYPFVFGFTVYESFESDVVAKSGKLNMPEKGEQEVGGHAIMAVGYDDTTKRFIIRNSWGSKWGKSGYFTIPYDYVLNGNLSDDFWTIRMVEIAPAAKPKKKAAAKIRRKVATKKIFRRKR